MFGYVKIYKPELKCRELDCYRAVYCGLCRAQGRCTGQCSRMTLSYDMAFLALFRMALTGETPVIREHRCPVHPLRRRPMMEPNGALTATAAAAALLSWYKLRDDMADESGLRRLRADMASPLLAPAHRRVRRMTLAGSADSRTDAALLTGADMEARIAVCMTELAALEKCRPASVDEPADLFGALMGDILAFGLTGTRARIGREAGRHIGRWVYILDAADDYAADVGRGRYNPFACLYGTDEASLSEEKRMRVILPALDCEADEAVRVLDLMDVTDRDTEGVLRNVLTQGMHHTAREILSPAAQKHTRKGKTPL